MYFKTKVFLGIILANIKKKDIMCKFFNIYNSVFLKIS